MKSWTQRPGLLALWNINWFFVNVVKPGTLKALARISLGRVPGFFPTALTMTRILIWLLFLRFVTSRTLVNHTPLFSLNTVLLIPFGSAELKLGDLYISTNGQVHGGTTSEPGELDGVGGTGDSARVVGVTEGVGVWVRVGDGVEEGVTLTDGEKLSETSGVIEGSSWRATNGMKASSPASFSTVLTESLSLSERRSVLAEAALLRKLKKDLG